MGLARFTALEYGANVELHTQVEEGVEKPFWHEDARIATETKCFDITLTET